MKGYSMFDKYGFTEPEIQYTRECFSPEKLNANNFFLKEGQTSNRIGLVKKGFLRSFFYDINGDEVTTQFFKPNSLVISFDSFNNQVASNENIVALTEAELFVISFSNMKRLYQKISAWNQVCKDYADQKSNEMLSRAIQFQTLSASERYHSFCAENPEIFKYAALKHIASYLGIDISTLSRIRNKK